MKSYFIIDFLCTLLLFALSFLLTLGVKLIIIAVKAKFPKSPPPVNNEPEKKPPVAKKRPKTVRTIELDPSEINRIYFKKSS